MIHISASLLAADYARLGEEVQRAAQAGVDSFHFDLMDGHYVPNLALAPDHLKALRSYTSLPFHVHLELGNPDEALSFPSMSQADMITVQWCTLTEPIDTIRKIRNCGARIGLGLDPGDSCKQIIHLLDEIDELLVLGVFPGFGGQVMMPGIVEKIILARHFVDQCDREIRIAVDGGVKPENAAYLVEAGADCLIMGTALFGARDMAETVGQIREAVSSLPPH